MKKLSILAIMLLSSAITLTSVFAFNALDFPDVDPSAYYAEPLSHMVSRGVISGYENGNFGPDDAVTRAQIVTMLDRYDLEVNQMKRIICEGFTRDDLPDNSPYGNVQSTYDTLCVD